MLGCIRLAIIYIVSGMLGNLASAALLPFEPHTGPACSLASLLGAQITQHCLIWNLLAKPVIGLLKFCFMFILMVVCGLIFPTVNNIANLVAFLSGCTLIVILNPLLGFQSVAKKIKNRPRIFSMITYIDSPASEAPKSPNQKSLKNYPSRIRILLISLFCFICLTVFVSCLFFCDQFRDYFLFLKYLNCPNPDFFLVSWHCKTIIEDLPPMEECIVNL
ncbi:Inactive rhomboid protein 2 [Cichlidogyrus casuarinus]|uniref:Inactive rhomboid protein 2 n=1 Tax=Cichlidogyrus casuarinus TaxID=1844966 RepID=A0ABD2QBF3_9PLAT